MRFEEGCRAFRVTFQKIMAKKLPGDPLGPILSAHKKLVTAKLAEQVEEPMPNGEARKEKLAVSKAQKPLKDLNPSSTRDAKVLAKERKKTFLDELAVTSRQDKKSQALSSFSKVGKDEDEPGWAPLRDTYMLGSKLKDWDKMQLSTAIKSAQTKSPLDDSSEEE